MANVNKAVETNGNDVKTNPAAYVPFRTFIGAIESLEQGVPKKIDRTMWRNQSGVTQTQILMALRFLSLLDEEDRPTSLLHDLVEKKDHRKFLLGEVLAGAYESVLEHDLTKMTPKMLDDSFDAYSVSGDTKRKAVTFFLKAAKFAEVPMHPLLASQVRNTGPRGKRSPKPKGTFIGDISCVADKRYDAPATNSGSSKTVRLRGGGAVTLAVSADPFSMTAEDREFVFGLIDRLQKYGTGDDGESDLEEEVDES